MYCIFLDKVPIGYAILKDFPQKAQIGITIDEPFWGRGYGLAAIKLLEKEAKKKKCKRLGLLVNKHNLRALNLYKKLGYIDTNLKLLEKDI